MYLILLWALVGLIGRVHCRCSLVSIPEDERSIAYACMNGDLNDLDEISSDAEWIEFTVSRIPLIPSNAFSRFSKLRQLSFYNCHVTFIDPDAFAGLDRLEWLIFRGTRILVARTAWFQHLSNLRRLILNRCGLVYVEPDTFRGLSRLEILDLRDNDLNCLPIEELSYLRTLRIVHIDRNPWLCDCRQRLDSYFRSKSIHHETNHCAREFHLCKRYQCMAEVRLPSTSALEHWHKLQTDRSRIHINEFESAMFSSLDRIPDKAIRITISGLRIETLPRYGFFRFGNTLRILDLVDCGIVTIENNAFAGLHRLERLTLMGNRFLSVGSDWFRDLVSLRQLILQRNDMERFDRTALWHVGDTLKHLDIRYNRLRCLTTEEMSGLKKLERLDAIDNPWLCSCRRSMYEYLTAKNIGFDMNSGRCYENESEIPPVTDVGRHHQAVEADTIITGKVYWTSFEESISQANITIIRPGTPAPPVIDFKPTMTPAYDTGSCQPQKNDESTYICHRVPSLEELTVIPYTVHTIRVISSTIKKIPANTFARFNGYLSRLELRDCGIEKIEPGAFSNLYNLKYLSLANNQLESIDADIFRGLSALRELDLSRNNIHNLANDAFDDLPYLTYLDLSKNSMNCIGMDRMVGHLRYLSTLKVSDNPWSCLCAIKLIEVLQARRIMEHSDGQSLMLKEDCFVTPTPWTTVAPPMTTTSVPAWNETVEGSCTAQEDETGIRYQCTGGNLALLNTIPSTVTAIEFQDGHLLRLSPGSLWRFTNLRELVIRNSDLITIDEGAFQNLRNLKSLTITNNPLKTICSDCFVLQNLDRLDLRGNSIDYIEPGAFRHLKQLTYLNLEGNHLHCIYTSDLNDMPNVYIVEFSGNPLRWKCRSELEQFLEARKIRFVKIENSCEGKKLVRVLLLQNKTDGSFDCPSDCSIASEIDRRFFILFMIPILKTWIY